MKKWLLTASIAAIASNAYADEGMWQPHQLPKLEKTLQQKGLEIDAKSISKLTEFPMNAVISLGGCTASFVSPKGLAVTNHHCAYGSIQYNSTAKNNLIENGFLAKTHQQELPAAPGSRIYITEKVTNVTKQIKGDLPDTLTGAERYKAIDKKSKTIVTECEQDKSYRCSVTSFHGGLEYYLIKKLMIRDVRLVYAPAESVGNYGGDIDNWMWPRHTGDYSYYRAYVSKDGKPADYSKDNVPYQPKSFLKVSASGVKQDDFVMVAGYPGRTNRYRLADEVRQQFNHIYPVSKQYREDAIRIIEQMAPAGSDARVKYESTLAGLANYAKNFDSMIKSYHRSDFQQRKDQLEKDLNQWIDKKPARAAKYGKTIEQLNALIKEKQKYDSQDTVFSYVNRTAMMNTAKKLYRLAHEKNKPDIAREKGYQKRDLKRFEQGLKRMSNRYVAEVDKAALQHFLIAYAKLPADQHIKSLNRFFGLNPLNQSALTAKLDQMYQQTELGDESKRLAWMKATVADFEKSKDPFIQLAVATYKDDMAIVKRDKEIAGQFATLRPKYMEAIIAYNKALGNPVYADANSTLRVTYGNVKGYSPKDGNYMQPFTTLRGFIEKETGSKPFNSSKKALSLIEQKQYGDYYAKAINSVPVNFLSTVDTTGGNSGSPTLNGKAELVGLLFDGVFESVIGDWDYDPNLNRSIHVDSRYMLWVMEHVDGAHNLLDEMEIVR